MLTRSSHETLNSIHQLLGRIVTCLLYLHAAFYLNFYIAKGLLFTKIQQACILCGIFGIIALTAVGTTALAPVRRWSYRVFYITHVTLATALLPVLYFHVTHLRVYLYETAVIYILSVVLRALSSRSYEGTVKLRPNTNLLEVVVSLRGHRTLGSWQPGQHAYLSLYGPPFLRTFGSNPLTIASIPSLDGSLRFVARVQDGNTATLAHKAGQCGEPEATLKLTIEGPYGVATHVDRLLQYDRVLMVAGGVGATFIVPMYRQLLADLSPSTGSYRRQKVSFLWVAKSIADVTWAFPQDGKEREGFMDRLTVCLTQSNVDGGVSKTASALNVESQEAKSALAETDEGIELEERKNLLPDGWQGVASMEKEAGTLLTLSGRPNLERVVEETFAHGNTETIAVLVCGPKGLSLDLRKEVGKWVRRGREVWFWDEAFAL